MKGELKLLSKSEIEEKFRREVPFSKYFLDDAVESQSKLYDDYHDLLVEAMSDLEMAQRELGEKKADLDLEIRKLNAEGDTDTLQGEFKVFKVTESAISNAVDTHEDVKKLAAKVAEKKNMVNFLRGKVDSLTQRNSMIKQCCQLAIINYFGDTDFIRSQRGKVDKEIAKQTKVPKGAKKKKRRRKNG